jgi:protease I
MARIAFIVDQLFEDSEFRVPYDRARSAGHECVIVGLEARKSLRGKSGRETLTTEVAVREVKPDEFDALVIPGGYSPDTLRTDVKMVGLVRQLFLSGKPVAVICHGGWMLAEADVAEDRTLTSWPSIRTDLLNAGARWVDRDVVEDGNLITSRKPEDLPVFCAALLRQLRDGVAQRVKGAAPPQVPSEPPPGLRH